MNRRTTILTVFSIVLLSCLSLGDVKLPSVISDNMVLQRSSEVAIWGWADPGEKVTVKPSWNWYMPIAKSAVADDDGKWQVMVKTPKAGGPYSIEIKGNNTIDLENVMSGEVWVCSGQSNMQWPVSRTQNSKARIAEANFENIRLFTVPRVIASEPQDDCKGKWNMCSSETVANFSAVGYYFGKKLHEELDVPIGLISPNWGGTVAEAWTRKEALAENETTKVILEKYDSWVANFDQTEKKYEDQLAKWPEMVEKAKAEGKKAPRKPRKPALRHQNSPCSLYNGMIAPVIPFGIKGAVWYQGESNAARAYQYKTLFPVMIENWRNDWGIGEFPFYFVQIAPYRNQNPEIRYAQLLTMQKVANTGMVVTTDIGNPEDIHPQNKVDVGNRLALWALANDYGQKKLVHSGPIYKSMKIEKKVLSFDKSSNKQVTKDSIRLYFDHVGGGLKSVGAALSDFTIAGADKVFHPAQAVIDGDTVVVSTNKVKNPLAVRFAWTNTAEPNFFNAEGLPASPFKTDEWTWATQDNQ